VRSVLEADDAGDAADLGGALRADSSDADSTCPGPTCAVLAEDAFSTAKFGTLTAVQDPALGPPVARVDAQGHDVVHR